MARAKRFGPVEENLTVQIGQAELVVSQRYDMAGIVNDFLIAFWFLAGSVLFLDPATTELGTWLFVIGSAQFMIRPLLRLAHHLHLRRVPPNCGEM